MNEVHYLRYSSRASTHARTHIYMAADTATDDAAITTVANVSAPQPGAGASGTWVCPLCPGGGAPDDEEEEPQQEYKSAYALNVHIENVSWEVT